MYILQDNPCYEVPSSVRNITFSTKQQRNIHEWKCPATCLARLTKWLKPDDM